jgi:8-oxo-dGTP pyrophosphatase MutT (NUDIX family)
MLRLIPPPAHRAGLRLAHAVRKRWWQVRRPHLNGCRVVAIDAGARVLLIRHSYGSGKWMLPGGGLKPGEDAIAAALRELREEAGCGLVDARIVAVTEDFAHGAPNRVHVIAGLVHGEVRADGREIIEAAFFALDALPEAMAAGLGERLADWVHS